MSGHTANHGARRRLLLPLAVLSTAQFVMVLDQSVMNVSISTLVHDFNTTVPVIQAVITLYCLVMAMLMLTGAKVGDIVGRRRAFVIGLVIYGCGSLMTALAPTVAVLALGWSILEGVGAALVLPALAALIAGTFAGPQRKLAYAVIGGVAGAGIAIGPILGGWATTELSWRVVFAGEVVLVIAILALVRSITPPPRLPITPHLDVVGAVLSASGLGAVVLGVLQSSTWGWVISKNSPVEPFGLSLTLFVIAFGGVLLYAFVRWQRRREHTRTDPLVHLDLLRVAPLRAGLGGLFTQNLVLMGVFFVVPLYLQMVIGLNALDTGLRMLPVSIAMFAASLVGSALSSRIAVRPLVRTGLLITFGAVLALLATIQPTLSNAGFAIAMALLGTGMGLIVSQLGNVVQSSVESSGRSEAGGLQYTGQQLGSSLGVALIGAMVLSTLTTAFVTNVQSDPRISSQVAAQVGINAGSGTNFLSTDQVSKAAAQAGLDEATAAALVSSYSDAQLTSLKVGLLVAALLALVSLAFTRQLPRASPSRQVLVEQPVAAAAT